MEGFKDGYTLEVGARRPKLELIQVGSQPSRFCRGVIFNYFEGPQRQKIFNWEDCIGFTWCWLFDTLDDLNAFKNGNFIPRQVIKRDKPIASGKTPSEQMLLFGKTPALLPEIVRE